LYFFFHSRVGRVRRERGEEVSCFVIVQYARQIMIGLFTDKIIGIFNSLTIRKAAICRTTFPWNDVIIRVRLFFL
jgi:hypothetical protein